MMEEADIDIPDGITSISPEFLHESFLAGTNYLKTRASYIWVEGRRPETWTVGSWSKAVQRSEIEKHGTDGDKAHLPPPGRMNLPHGPARRKRKRATEQTNSRTRPRKTPKRKPKVKHESISKQEEELPTEQTPTEQNIDQAVMPIMPTQFPIVVDGPYPAEPHYGREVIQRADWDRLLNQGTMLTATVVRSYLNVLSHSYYGNGFRRAGDNFYPTLKSRGWQAVVEEQQRMMKFPIDWENDLVIVIPLFYGATESGHFAFLVVDRTRYDPGFFLYLDTIPTSYNNHVDELERLIKMTSMWKDDSVFAKLGDHQIPTQGATTMDCGVFTSVFASAYMRALQRNDAYSAKRRGSIQSGSLLFVKVNCSGNTIEWGSKARRHIAETLLSGDIDFGSPALCKLNIIMLDEKK